MVWVVMSKKYERELREILERSGVRANHSPSRFRWFGILFGGIYGRLASWPSRLASKYRNIVILGSAIICLFLVTFLPISLGMLGPFVYVSVIIFLILFSVSFWRDRGGMEKRWRGKKIE